MSGRSLAIITARGGSKRIPRKNIKEFDGKPIITYSIRAALDSACFDEVMVSTDDAEIASVARGAGASVPFFRSAKTSGDYATTAEVVREVIDTYRDRGVTFDTICCIYPTAPFVTARKLAEARRILDATSADSVITVVRFGFPPQRALIRTPDGGLAFWMPENAHKRSQDLEPIYHDAGQFYFLNVRSFDEQRCLVMRNTVPFECSETEVQDIDNESDWTIAELKYRLMIRCE